MYDNLRDAVGSVMAAIIAIFLAMVIAAGLSLAGWKIHAWLSPAQGAAQQQVDNNSATNRETAQDAFNALDAAIKGDVYKIHQDQSLYGDNPTDPTNRSELILDRAKCVADVGEYNKDAADMNMKDWRPAQDPASFTIDACN